MKCFGIKLFVLILCFKIAVSGFFFGSSLLNWESARDDCQTRGKRLACLRNVTMYNAAKSYLQNTIGSSSLSNDIWIGQRTLFALPPYIYKCMDNEPGEYTPWNSNFDEPNEQNTDLCIRIYRVSITYGTWECSDKNHYLCEGDVPVNGNWSEWTTWSACSVTSGDGSQSRFRSCDSPPPSNGGTDCMGVNTEDKFCNVVVPVDGVWSVWGEWSNCSFVMCGVGNRTRSRSCDSPPPSVGGKNCEGEPEGSEGCDDLVCSSDEYWICSHFQEITPVVLQEKIEEIIKTLAVNKSTLSSEVRRKTCAEDPRPSSKYMGLVAIVFLGVSFGLLFMVDFSSSLKLCFKKYL